MADPIPLNAYTAAQQYVELGLEVFPVSQQKYPETTHGFKDASSDPHQLAVWWKNNPDRGIAVRCRDRILLAIDVDVKGEAKGLETWEGLLEAHGEIPDTVLVRTASGGMHCWFTIDPDLKIRRGNNVLGPGIDVKDYVLVPPSKVLSGGVLSVYTFFTGCAPGEVEIAPAPQWLLDRLKPLERDGNPRNSTQADSDTEVSALVKRALEQLTRSGGNRNETGYWFALYLRDTARCSRKVALLEQEQYWEDANELFPKPGESPYTLEQALEQVQRVYAEPRRAPAGPSGRDGLEEEEEGKYEHSDLGNAQRFADHYGPIVAWVPRLKEWFAWDGTCWREDAEMMVARFISELHRDMWLSVHKAAGDPESKLTPKAKWALECGNAHRLAGAMNFAKPLVELPLSTFNQRPLLIPGANGWTYDLEQGGILRPSLREDFMTRTLPVAFEQDPGRPEKTLAFLRMIFGDKDEHLTYVLDRVIGPLLTGSMQAQEFFLFYSQFPDAGKTTLLRYLTRLLGPFATSIPLRGLLKHRETNYIRHDIAGLRGCRLGYTEEFKEGDTLDTSTIKAVTGGGDIMADEKGKPNITFSSTAKLIIATNILPELEYLDEAIRKRLRVVPFLRSLPFYLPSKGLKVRNQEEVFDELIEEAPAFVHLLVSRLAVTPPSLSREQPDAFAAYTQEYFEDQDPVGSWIADSCVRGERWELPFKDWHRSFLLHSGMDGKRRGTATWFGKRLLTHGFSKRRTNTGPRYEGPLLTQEANQALVEYLNNHSSSQGSQVPDDEE